MKACDSAWSERAEAITSVSVEVPLGATPAGATAEPLARPARPSEVEGAEAVPRKGVAAATGAAPGAGCVAALTAPSRKVPPGRAGAASSSPRATVRARWLAAFWSAASKRLGVDWRGVVGTTWIDSIRFMWVSLVPTKSNARAGPGAAQDRGARRAASGARTGRGPGGPPRGPW